MLFHSPVFIFIFVPVVFLGFTLLAGKAWNNMAIAWLVVASLVFYSWWNPWYLFLLIPSIAFNYLTGKMLTRRLQKFRFLLLTSGVLVNLAVLSYFKYTYFFLHQINTFFECGITVAHIVLPIGISFFTFQQIAYLADSYQGKIPKYSFLHYSFFVSFFPQIIAGPIVYHHEFSPQLEDHKRKLISAQNIAVGFSLFVFGLGKKVLLADGMAGFADPVFTIAAAGQNLSMAEAWTGALAYSFQLYFDFSGYSDMAIGLARIFGIILPLNFNSPYQAVNIIDFWRRWHITLSRFFMEYLYVPLGGNRKGRVRNYINLLLTMGLCGLWHGAGWTFIAWGALHGVLLAINHGWRSWKKKSFFIRFDWIPGNFLGRSITFLVVVVSWVLFRAESFETAIVVIKSMFWLPPALDSWAMPDKSLLQMVCLVLFCWLAPNVYQLMAGYNPCLVPNKSELKPYFTQLQWRPSWFWSLVTSLIAVLAIFSLSETIPFVYFQF